MKMIKLLIATIIFSTLAFNANAQIGRAIQRGVERSVEKQIEKETTKAIDKAFEDAEADRAKKEEEAAKAAAENITETQPEQQKNQMEVADIQNEIPEVSNTPYTPSESEYSFFAMKAGIVQEVITKDEKGKITGQVRNTITGITGDKNAFAIAYQSEILDEKGKPVSKDNPLILNLRVVVKDDLVYLDTKGMLAAMEGLDDMQVTGTAMKIPTNLSVGQSLEDASAKVRIGFINCTAVMTEGKCLAIEDVTVEAGTFKCHKISQKTNATAMGIKSEGTTLTWYAKGVGIVKSETYDKKGKLQSTQELKSSR